MKNNCKTNVDYLFGNYFTIFAVNNNKSGKDNKYKRALNEKCESLKTVRHTVVRGNVDVFPPSTRRNGNPLPVCELRLKSLPTVKCYARAVRKFISDINS